MILDIMMPKMDGLEVLKTMRRKKDTTPVLLLTARDSVEDRVRGLDLGADDYLVKPFAFEELSARIRVMLRKPEKEKSSVCSVADLHVHLDTAVFSEERRRLPFVQRICRAQISDTERGHCSVQGEAGTAYLEL